MTAPLNALLQHAGRFFRKTPKLYQTEQLKLFFKWTDTVTHRAPRIGLVAGKVTDAGGVQSEIIYHQR